MPLELQLIDFQTLHLDGARLADYARYAVLLLRQNCLPQQPIETIILLSISQPSI